MFEDIVWALLGADRVIIPFSVLHETQDVQTIVAATGGEFSSFDFVDDDVLNPSSLSSTYLEAAVSGLTDFIELFAPITVEAAVTWTATKSGRSAAVHSMIVSGARGERAVLSREGAVYGYSMALLGSNNRQTSA